MKKDVIFHFRNGMEEMLQSVQVNEHIMSSEVSREVPVTICLNPRKNNMTLIFNSGKRFAAPLPGGDWDKIIISDTGEKKRLTKVLAGIVVVGVLVLFMSIWVKSEVFGTPGWTGLAGAATVHYFILKRSRYSVIFR